MGILKKTFAILFRISISIVLLIFLFRGVNRKALFELIRDSNKMLLFFSFCIFSLTHVLGTLRWKILLKAADIHIPLNRIIISMAGGIFFNLFLPSTIGGDLVRSLDLAAHTKKPREVVATVFLDRLSGYTGLAALALISVCFGWRYVKDRVVLVSVFIIAGLLVCVLLVLFNRHIYALINKFLHPSGQKSSFSRLEKIREAIKNLHREIHIFRHHRRIMFYNLGISFLLQVIAAISFWMIGLSLGVDINIIYYFIYLPIIGAITILPISLGGLGLRDATTIYFFTKVGVSKYLAFAMSLLNFFFVLIIGGIGGIIYVLTIHYRRIQYHKAPAVFKQ